MERLLPRATRTLPMLAHFGRPGTEITPQLGKKQGERNMQLRIARQMLAAKLPLQQISEMTALSMSELQKLQNTGN